MEYLLGIDSGTSVVKAAIIDEAGHEVARGSRAVPVLSPEPHLSEGNMPEVWESACFAINEAIQHAGITADQIRAVAATGQGDGMWTVDKAGNPVSAAYLWNDGRAGDLVDGWNNDGTISKAFPITGNGPYAGTTAPLLRWRLDNEPEIAKRDDLVNLWCKDWISYKLTGELSTDPSDASLMGIDTVNRDYSDEVFEIYGMTGARSWMPPIKAKTDQVGTVTRAAAMQTGLIEGTPVFKGGIDISCSSLGCGVADVGSAMAVVGTAGIVTVCTDKPADAFAPADVGWLIPHGDKTWIRSMGMNAATPNLDWFLREFGLPFREEAEAQPGRNLFQYLDQEVPKVPLGSGGVMYHGYNAPGGERAPFIKPSARASFNGITNSHTRWHLLRAVYEGVAFGIRDCLDSIPIEVTSINMAGGGAASPVWSQIFADVLGREVVVPAGTEFGAKGAAICAGAGIGMFDSLEDGVKHMVQPIRSHQPDRAKTEIYDEFFAVYRKQRDATMGVWDDLQKAVRRAAAAS